MLARLTTALALAASLLGQAQTLPFEPPHDSGSSVTGAFEGWFRNPDGSFSLLLGYYNRNRQQELDIPIGPNNRIEPGGPDRGQPTHFMPGRCWGMFVIQVPANFGQSRLTWTLTANGKTTVIPGHLHTDYEIAPFAEAAVGNTPPALRFDEKGPSLQGPGDLVAERRAKVGTPLPLSVWVSDDGKWTTNSGARPKEPGVPVTLRWTQYRGPSNVTFSNARPAVEKGARPDPAAAFTGHAAATATFNEPGDYVLHVVANDYSGDGGGGFQCCWTTGRVRVSVAP
jgi:hypothetical protein